MRKLNNKGFTLIELLAVIVILALIMVIAIPQVLNSINNSRVSALHSEARSIVDAYSNAYMSDQLASSTGELSVITGTINKGVKVGATGNASWKCINDVEGFATWAGLKETEYKLSGTAPAGTKSGTTLSNAIGTVSSSTCSAVRKINDGKIEIFLVANPNGRFQSGNGTITYAYSEDSNGSVQ